jgi:biotin transport system substrate-specific component
MRSMENNMENKKSTTYQLALIGVMTALTCILGPMSVVLPFTPVPISLTNLVVYLSVCLLGWRLGTVSYLVYLLIGLVGLPVFSGFTGGAGKLFGPTGGYLIGFIFMAIVAGLFMERQSRWYFRLLGMILGTLIAYLFGTLWLAYVAKMNFQGALAAGVLPFIPGDLVKMLLILLAAPLIETRIRRAGLSW